MKRSAPLARPADLLGRLGLALALTAGSLSASDLHPEVQLLDRDGKPIHETRGAFSPGKSCGVCHDSAYIEGHSYHASLGQGESGGARPFDHGPGRLGRWDPLAYDRLSPSGSEKLEIGLAAWIQSRGPNLVGGGPTRRSANGQLLEELTPGTTPTVETHVLDASGQPQPWDWAGSGGLEMDCMVCHAGHADSGARGEEISRGRFAWAPTATLARSGLVEGSPGNWTWKTEALGPDSLVSAETLALGRPRSENCGTCHALVHREATPLVPQRDPSRRAYELMGTIYSSQRLSESGMNLAGKEDHAHAFDLHAERMLDCASCHFSLNDPRASRESDDSRPGNLRFDGRKLSLGEFLRTPSHHFAKGDTPQGTVARNFAGTMRRCEDCHDAGQSHDWLPYQERHLGSLSCESCHIPRVHAPARMATDWTLPTADGEARVEYRGVEGALDDPRTLVTGYQPALVPRKDRRGGTKLFPANLVSTWYWADASGTPVPRRLLLEALFVDGQLVESVRSLLDRDKDGKLSESERVLTGSEAVEAVRKRLEAVGVPGARIAAEVQPYTLHHGTVTGEYATRSCVDCHSGESPLLAPLPLARQVPGGVAPTLVGDSNVDLGDGISTEDGRLVYRPGPLPGGGHAPGATGIPWTDILGLAAFVGALLGALGHGALRYLTHQEGPHHAMRRVYIYRAYERIWHWVQAAAIMALLVTGLEVHVPGRIHILGFGAAATAHELAGFVLLGNAFLGLFYHLTTGQIREYLPAPRDFFSQAFEQVRYYTWGIFRGAPHPFEKRPGRRLNPLQQVTYLAILNVLLPVQVITGLALWGVGRWPELAARVGGPFWIGGVHSLCSWLFAAFLVMHVYLTTTGHTPTSNMEAMITGWEEIEDSEEESP